VFCFINCFENAATGGRQNQRPEHRPTDNPQREDFVTKRKKERVALMLCEKKIASLWTILAVIRRIPLRERIVAANNPGSQNQLRKIFERVITLLSVPFRSSCTLPRRARNMAVFRMIDRRNNQHSSPTSRHSPPNTPTLLASKAPTGLQR
jgi:hypothetical protein